MGRPVGYACPNCTIQPPKQAIVFSENLRRVGKSLGYRRYGTTASYAHLADEHRVEGEGHGVITPAMKGPDGRRNRGLDIV